MAIRILAPPAIVAGLAMWFLTQAFTFLAPRLVGVAALAGSLATAFIALAWLSFLFQALLYGAAWVRVREERNEPRGQATWDVPQRRQNRAVAESDSPQLRHGWTPPWAGAPRDQRHRYDLAIRLGPERFEAAGRLAVTDGSPAVVRWDGHSGCAGHCGSVGGIGGDGRGRGRWRCQRRDGRGRSISGATICQVGCSTTSTRCAASASAGGGTAAACGDGVLGATRLRRLSGATPARARPRARRASAAASARSDRCGDTERIDLRRRGRRARRRRRTRQRPRGSRQLGAAATTRPATASTRAKRPGSLGRVGVVLERGLLSFVGFDLGIEVLAGAEAVQQRRGLGGCGARPCHPYRADAGLGHDRRGARGGRDVGGGDWRSGDLARARRVRRHEVDGLDGLQVVGLGGERGHDSVCGDGFDLGLGAAADRQSRLDLGVSAAE